MAKEDKTGSNGMEAYLAGTGEVMTQFVARTAAFAPPEAAEVVRLIAATIERSTAFVAEAVEAALEAGGVGVDEIQETLDSFGAGQLIEGLTGQLKAATSAADLAVIGTILPIIKKIIRFVVQIREVRLEFDLDRILEFIDELATTAFDLVSPKGAEAMHRSELRFLESQFHLDRLASLREAPADSNGR